MALDANKYLRENSRLATAIGNHMDEIFLRGKKRPFDSMADCAYAHGWLKEMKANLEKLSRHFGLESAREHNREEKATKKKAGKR